jgi:hemoglobin
MRRRFFTNYFILGVTLSLLLLSGCSATPATKASLYDDLGGAQGIDAIVRNMLINIAHDAQIKPRFKAVNIAHFRRGFSEYLCAVADGPCKYTGDSLQQVHAGHNYTHSEFNAVVAHLIEAMQQAKTPLSAQNNLLKRLAVSYKQIVYQ